MLLCLVLSGSVRVDRVDSVNYTIAAIVNRVDLMPLELLSVKVPKEWLDRINELAEAQRLSKSDILKAAIAAYLGIATGDDEPTALSRILERLDRLEAQFTELTANKQNSSIGQIEANQRIIAKNRVKDETLAGAESTAFTGDSRRGKSPDCPKCGSGATRWEGYGKVRRDGTRLPRIRCRDCDKVSTIS